MLTYHAEYLDHEDHLHTKEFACDLQAARVYARRESKRLKELIYVIAFDERLGDSVGEEVYYNGRRDSTDGKIVA